MALKRAMLLSVLQQYLTLLITLGTTIVIARLLEPAEVGVYAICMAIVGLVGSLKEFGVGSFLISSRTLDTRILRAAYGLTWLTTGLFALLLLALSAPAGEIYHNLAVTEVMRIFAFAHLFSAFGFIPNTLLAREMRFGPIAIIGLIAVVMQSSVSVALALCGFSYSSLAWGQVAYNVSGPICLFIYRPGQFLLRPSLTGIGSMLHFGGLLTATTFIANGAMRAPEIILGRTLSLADVALFARAQQVVSIIRMTFYTALMRPVLAAFTQHEEHEVGKLYLRVVGITTGIGWPAYAFLLSWGDSLVGIVYGPKWIGVGPLIFPLCIAQAMTLAVTPHYDVLISKNKVRLLFVSETLSLAVSLVALAAAAQLGLLAVAWSTVFGSLFFVIWYMLVIGRLLDLKLADFFSVWSRSLPAAVLVVAICMSSRHFMGETSALVTLSACVLTAVTSGLVCLLSYELTNHELKKHVRQGLVMIGSFAKI